MKHARPDYSRIQDPSGRIPEDEPVFMVRAQDRYAVDVLKYYIHLLTINDGDLALIALAKAHVKLMQEWPVKREPDLVRLFGLQS